MAKALARETAKLSRLGSCKKVAPLGESSREEELIGVRYVCDKCANRPGQCATVTLTIDVLEYSSTRVFKNFGFPKKSLKLRILAAPILQMSVAFE
jgi:hypothetical protein